MSIHNKINICDVSHRDGSYLNDFRVNARHTEDIVLCVDDAGVDFVEIGHGLGISGGTFNLPAALKDIEYCQIAQQHAKKTKWGTFCIAEKCDESDVLDVLSYKPNFIKVGIEPNRFKESKRIIDIVSDSDTEAILFFMKSYAWSMNEMLDAIDKSINDRINKVYIVDSAGTMLPRDIAFQISTFLNSFPNIEIGFHGHNNLGLAVSNSITAVENGATYIDCSMLGVGRSGGNCCIEQFIFVLQRLGIKTNIDVFKLLEFSTSKLPHIYPMQHVLPLDIIFGSSGFHSAFFSKVREAAEKNNIDINRLSYELGKITRVNPTTEELERAISIVSGVEWTAI